MKNDWITDKKNHLQFIKFDFSLFHFYLEKEDKGMRQLTRAVTGSMSAESVAGRQSSLSTETEHTLWVTDRGSMVEKHFSN